ncbi:hypothetical protein KQX64_20000 [Rhodopseudomonas palustris]|nr:hypothetical protein KQX64_20000 [Rhodopseudomonas palustris]
MEFLFDAFVAAGSALLAIGPESPPTAGRQDWADAFQPERPPEFRNCAAGPPESSGLQQEHIANGEQIGYVDFAG